MNSRFVIMAALTVGSVVGSYLPTLWGAGFFSMWSILLGAIGGFVGIWVGYKLSRL